MIERTGNPLFYLDSMIFIYAVEEDAIHGPAARELLTYFQRRTGTAVTSELSLAEVLAPNKRRGVIPLKLRQAYIDLIVSDGRIVLESISRSILFETADL